MKYKYTIYKKNKNHNMMRKKKMLSYSIVNKEY